MLCSVIGMDGVGEKIWAFMDVASRACAASVSRDTRCAYDRVRSRIRHTARDEFHEKMHRSQEKRARLKSHGFEFVGGHYKYVPPGAGDVVWRHKRVLEMDYISDIDKKYRDFRDRIVPSTHEIEFYRITSIGKRATPMAEELETVFCFARECNKTMFMAMPDTHGPPRSSSLPLPQGKWRVGARKDLERYANFWILHNPQDSRIIPGPTPIVTVWPGM